jgi:tight adherence protein C
VDSLPPLIAVAATAAGAVMVLAGTARSRRVTVEPEAYLRGLQSGPTVVDDFQRKLAEPFRVRAMRAITGGALSRIERITPRSHLESIRRKLTLAGRDKTSRAEELLAAQIGLVVGLALLALLLVTVVRPPGRIGVTALVLLPVVGALVPLARLDRLVAERQQAILMDLPDTLDLLAISVEAGLGFEGAVEVVCQHFESPLADEFTRVLQEMELGLSRRDAFQNLKQRTEVVDLSTFVLAVVQADALGVPIGRVLKTQATEMRSKRRMWAREKAGKLPVKILFPLMLFIFPPILVIIMGPAVSTLRQSFG